MFTIYHYPLCPLSRQIRVYLSELGLEFKTIKEEYWLKNPSFIAINPAGHLPILQIGDSYIIGTYPITEYLSDAYENFHFMPNEAIKRTEIRRVINWFNEKFYNEVSKVLLQEKMIRTLSRAGEPRTDRLRIIQSNFIKHMHYLAFLLTQNAFLASDNISCADIVGATHISILDYFSEIDWSKWLSVGEWYSVIKSRPSFRPILQDQIGGFMPPKYYAELDFY